MGELADWHDFYVMLGAAAATLTGLVVVAMSLHLRAIADTPLHRGLARGSLIALMAIVVACAVGLLPGSLATFGTEIAVLGAGLAAYNALLVARATRLPGAFDRRRTTRASLYIASPVVCAASGAAMGLGIGGAAYVLAATLVVTLVLTVTNTWSLLLDVSDEDRTPA